MPKQANELLSAKGERGVQAETLEPGTYYLNPYVQEVRVVDCRSQRYNLKDIGFPTRDGFWVSLEAIIEFRVKPEQAASTYILYNEERAGKNLAEEVITKVILPNARAYTRLRGSNHSGQGIHHRRHPGRVPGRFSKGHEIDLRRTGHRGDPGADHELTPPEKIADPVRRRQIALQQEAQYGRKSSSKRPNRNWPCKRPPSSRRRPWWPLAGSGGRHHRGQEEAGGGPDRRQHAPGRGRTATGGRKDLAAAIMAKGKADADVIQFANQAEAAGWQKSIAAFSGNGNEFARWTLYKKLAPAFRSMMINTENSPLMDVFKSFDSKPK